jgi:hypothetical protein
MDFFPPRLNPSSASHHPKNRNGLTDLEKSRLDLSIRILDSLSTLVVEDHVEREQHQASKGPLKQIFPVTLEQLQSHGAICLSRTNEVSSQHPGDIGRVHDPHASSRSLTLLEPEALLEPEDLGQVGASHENFLNTGSVIPDFSFDR